MAALVLRVLGDILHLWCEACARQEAILRMCSLPLVRAAAACVLTTAWATSGHLASTSTWLSLPARNDWPPLKNIKVGYSRVSFTAGFFCFFMSHLRAQFLALVLMSLMVLHNTEGLGMEDAMAAVAKRAQVDGDLSAQVG